VSQIRIFTNIFKIFRVEKDETHNVLKIATVL